MADIQNVLLDRDGTLIVEKHYLHDPAQVELAPGAGQALAKLTQAGLKLFVVTNQSGIGRGYYAEADFWAVQQRLDELLAPFGVRLDGVAHCPHAPQAQCACRKPKTGLWSALCASAKLDPKRTVMIGDNASDVAFGLELGFNQSILVLTGHGRRYASELELPPLCGPWMEITPRLPHQPTVLAQDLAAAAGFILSHMGLDA